VKNTVKKIESILGAKVPVGPSFGCSDANCFNTNGSGLKVFDIGDGVFDSHTYREHISVEDLGRLSGLVLGLARA
jgi:di/tripeptidase